MSTDLTKLPIDYATKDYEGFMEMFKTVIPTLTPEWTDMSNSDQGIVILQLLAYGLHIQSYAIDKGAMENLLPLAKTQKAILNLTKFLGYEISKQTPATVPIIFTKESDKLDTEVIIPGGTKISTDPSFGEAVIFETDVPLIIPAGTLSGTVQATQGESVDREQLGIGNGMENQSFVLEQMEVLDESVYVMSVENGTVYEWTKVPNFLESLPNDRHYITELTEDSETRIVFGDGKSGMKVPFNAELTADYRFGGGAKGNLAPGLINYLYDDFIRDIDNVTNEEQSSGGTDYEDLEQSKTLAPKAFRAGGKAVTPEDFEDLAETFPGIARAVCKETFNITSDVNLYLATETGVPLTDELKNAVKESIEDVMVMNQTLYVHPVIYKDYNLDMTIYLADNTSQANAKMEVEGLIRNYTDPNNFDFGDTVYLNAINQNAFFARGVKNSIINSPATDVVTAETELPRLVTLTVNVVGGVVSV
jgi:Baseplate J-like protein